MNSFFEKPWDQGHRAPPEGFILACYPDTLVFAPYVWRGGYPVFEGCAALRDVTPGECHLFDADRELRLLYRESTGEWLDMLLTAEEERDMDPDLIFEESVLVKPRYTVSGRVPEKLKIINRYRYSEYDTLTLDNYRISCEAPPER